VRRALAAAALVPLLALTACGGGDDAATSADGMTPMTTPMPSGMGMGDDQMAARNSLMTTPMPGMTPMPMMGKGADAPVLPCTGLDRPVPGATPAGDGRTLPDLSLSCLGGGPPVTLRGLRGPMVLNVWASWCGPCREELPFLVATHAALKDRVRFLGIDLRDDDGPAREWLSYNGVGWPSLADAKGSIRGPLSVPGPPVTLFVNSAGQVVGVHYGQFTSAAQVQAAIAEHLGVA
jgi:thiol-disulfide isomerase/thioredoxin